MKASFVRQFETAVRHVEIIMIDTVQTAFWDGSSPPAAGKDISADKWQLLLKANLRSGTLLWERAGIFPPKLTDNTHEAVGKLLGWMVFVTRRPRMCELHF